MNLLLTRNVVDFSDFVRKHLTTSKKLYPKVGEIIGKIFTDFYKEKLVRILSNIPEVRITKVSRLVSNFLHVCYLQDQPSFRIADIGCGEGQSTQALGKAFPGAKVLGIDIDQRAIAYAKKHTTAGNISFLCKLLQAVLKFSDLF